jgi:hypothetical protein
MEIDMATKTEASDYEIHLVTLMRDYHLTLSEALSFDFEAECIDMSNVFDPCEFLEEKLVNLEKVMYYMMVWTGQEPDIELKRIE